MKKMYRLITLTIVPIFLVAGVVTVAAEGSSSAASGCRAPAHQVCPIVAMPTVTNRVQIAAELAKEPLTPGSIATIVANEEKSAGHWQGPTAAAKAPTGLKLALITCDSALAGCVSPLTGVQQAATALGWTTTMYNGASNPATINSDFLIAIAAGDSAILYTSTNPLVIQEGLLAAKTANIPVISLSAGSSQPDPTVATPKGKAWPLLDVSSSYVNEGREMADWVINDSKGKGNVLVLADKEDANTVSQAAAIDEFNRRCHKCTVSSFAFLGATVATGLPAQTVDYLRSHPKVHYIILPFDPAAGTVVPALKTAGLTKVKVISLLGDAQNVAFIRAGEGQTADAANDNIYMGWSAVDQLIRHDDNLPLFKPLGENEPTILIVKRNAPASVPATGWSANFNYKSKYLNLWK